MTGVGSRRIIMGAAALLSQACMERATMMTIPHRHRFERGIRLCLAVAVGFLASCGSDNLGPGTGPAPGHPDWSYNASIYEVNVRQYSPGGTFEEFREHLPRLKDLGVGILWFMPIHPIGELNRKGSLGSYYSVKDYFGVNPEFGTFDDFKALVDSIHKMGMYVMIDWVANHTAWDNPLTVDHPDWYVRDEHGNFVPPIPAWSDVIQLDYGNSDLRAYMIDAMRFWIEEADVDGFRCDAAGMVPLSFWRAAIAELRDLKPLLMLAEWETPAAHEDAFDMTYGLSLHYLVNSIAWGQVGAAAIGDYVVSDAYWYPDDAYRMYFTSNHDVNSWDGTVFERLGDGVEAFAVLVSMLDGMPLVYSGQEVGLDRRLAFFDKDQIEWGEHELTELYTRLLNLKKENRALWNGNRGGDVNCVHTSNDDAVFAFVRTRASYKVFVILNLSDAEQDVELMGTAYVGAYIDVLTDEPASFQPGTEVTLAPWDYAVYSSRP